MTAIFSIKDHPTSSDLGYAELQKDYRLRISIVGDTVSSYTLEKKQSPSLKLLASSISRLFARDRLEYIEGADLVRLIVSAKHSRPLTGRCTSLTTNADFKRFINHVRLSPATKAKLKRGLKKAKIIGRGLEKAAKLGKKPSMLCSLYWQEKLVPAHYGRDLSVFYSGWKADMSNKDVPFEEWMKGYLVESHAPTAVKYLTSTERKEYEASFREGKLYLKDAPVDTATMNTYQGPGSAIFVMGLDKKIYIGSHSISRFHHSSFLSGDATLGSGSIKTNEAGEIIEITNHSGHYKPSVDQILNTLEVLKENGVDLSKITVTAIQPTGEKLTYRNAELYLQARGKLDREPATTLTH